jgi:hypothetical protein
MPASKTSEPHAQVGSEHLYPDGGVGIEAADIDLDLAGAAAGRDIGPGRVRRGSGPGQAREGPDGHNGAQQQPRASSKRFRVGVRAP